MPEARDGTQRSTLLRRKIVYLPENNISDNSKMLKMLVTVYFTSGMLQYLLCHIFKMYD